MDITDGDQNRFETGIEMLEEGHSVICHGVSFQIDQYKEPRELAICSYSDYEPDRANEQMAMQKIERSRDVAKSMADKSPKFKALWDRYPHVYAFCWDYGMGAVGIAELRGTEFTWLMKNKA